MFIALTILIVIVSVVLIGLILMQSKNASGITGAIGGMGAGSAPTYWDKNKGRSMEGQLEKYTKICAFVYFVLIILANIIA